MTKFGDAMFLQNMNNNKIPKNSKFLVWCMLLNIELKMPTS